MTKEMLRKVEMDSSKVLTELQTVSAEFMRLIAPLSYEQFNKVSVEGGWSAAQVVRHVNMSDKGLLEMLHGPVRPTHRLPDEKVKQIRSTFSDFTIKMESPEFIIPASIAYNKERLVQSFLQTRSRLGETFGNSDLSETCLLFSFPVFENLTKLELLNFIVAHTQRHIHQLNKIIKKITGMKVIKKSVEIKALREKVWNVLTDDKSTRIWYAAFSEGTHAQTDWQVGSKAVFVDNSNCGMVSKVVVNKPGEMLSVEHQGIVMDGKEDYESDMAKAVNGGLETYHLSDKNGFTQLSIESDMAEEMFESMSLSWDKAVQKIKELSENNPQ